MISEAGGTHSVKGTDAINAELLAFLQDTVIERLTSIDSHFATLNGSVATAVRDIAACKDEIKEVKDEQTSHGIALARLQERDTHQKEQLGEVKSAAKDLLGKVWDNSIKVACVVATMAIIAKVAGLW